MLVGRSTIIMKKMLNNFFKMQDSYGDTFQDYLFYVIVGVVFLAILVGVYLLGIWLKADEAGFLVAGFMLGVFMTVW